MRFRSKSKRLMLYLTQLKAKDNTTAAPSPFTTALLFYENPCPNLYKNAARLENSFEETEKCLPQFPVTPSPFCKHSNREQWSTNRFIKRLQMQIMNERGRGQQKEGDKWKKKKT